MYFIFGGIACGDPIDEGLPAEPPLSAYLPGRDVVFPKDPDQGLGADVEKLAGLLQ